MCGLSFSSQCIPFSTVGQSILLMKHASHHFTWNTVTRCVNTAYWNVSRFFRATHSVSSRISCITTAIVATWPRVVIWLQEWHARSTSCSSIRIKCAWISYCGCTWIYFNTKSDCWVDVFLACIPSHAWYTGLLSCWHDMQTPDYVRHFDHTHWQCPIFFHLSEIKCFLVLLNVNPLLDDNELMMVAMLLQYYSLRLTRYI